MAWVAPSLATAGDRDAKLSESQGAIAELRLEGEPATDNCLRNRILFEVDGQWFNVDMKDKHAALYLQLLTAVMTAGRSAVVSYDADTSHRAYVQACGAFSTDRKYYDVRRLAAR